MVVLRLRSSIVFVGDSMLFCGCFAVVWATELCTLRLHAVKSLSVSLVLCLVRLNLELYLGLFYQHLAA